uniref:Reverse transcriptase domain-containing protein n=1 Tax=Tanacetum cinerariifolium TaxID=118510 RepID=A0A699H3W5_TANCI|nr:reverse transcriptase domain-containing protein [Tanacetum cinerariifolium]
MRTRSSFNLPGESSPNPTSSNPKRRNRRRSKQPFILEESPVDTIADQRTMTKLLRAPTEGYAEAILGQPIVGVKKNPRILFSLRRILFSNSSMILSPSRTKNIRNEIFNFQQWFDESFHEAWGRYKDLLRACPHHGFTKLHQLDTFYNALNPADQNSLNSAAGGNLLERRTQDVLTIIEKKSKVRNSRNKSIVSQVKSSDANSSSSSEIAKLTHAVNQQTSAVTTAMIAILKQFQATPPPVSVKAVEEICVTCGGPLPRNTIANPKGELKSITTRSGIVLDGPSVPMPPPFINPEEDERVEETLTDQDLAVYTIKVPPPLVQKPKPLSQRNFFVHQRDHLHPNIPYPSRTHKQKQQEKDEKMLKALLSNKDKLLELANTPLSENCSVVILKKSPEKLRDPGKFLIPCGFSELKCKALADLGASINLMPLSVLKKLGLPELISTRMTLELANRAICTPAGIARDVFVLAGKFTFPADVVIVDYESDPRVPLILGRPFLQTARPLIGEFTDELALITFPPRNDDLHFDIESDLKEIEYLLNHDPIKEMDFIFEDSIDEDSLADPNDNLVDTMPEMFTDEHALDYPSPPLYDEYEDDLFEVESDTEYVYDDPFDSKEDEIKESKLLIDELDLPRSSDFLPSLEYDSFFFEDFSEVDALPSTDNEDKVFNPGILIQENPFEIITRVAPDKNVKKLAISHASLILEDFDPPPYELHFHKEVPGSETLLLFSSKNEEKVFKPGILTSKGVHTSFLPELSHRGHKVFKLIKILESPMEIFPCSHGEDIRIVDVPCLHFYPP